MLVWNKRQTTNILLIKKINYFDLFLIYLSYLFTQIQISYV